MSELYFPSLSSNEMSGDGPASAAELHGALCGLLCLNSEANRITWYKSLYEEIDPSEEEILDLTALFDQTVQSLNSLDFDLQLELPTDNAPLPSRITAMSDWCHGLVFGLGTSGLTDDTELSADGKEYLEDVINISQLSNDTLDDNNEEEANFEELVEYLRMGLFLLHGELQPINPDNNPVEH